MSTSLRSIPQTDPRAGYLEQQAEIDAAVARVLAGGAYILGPEVEAFEAEFAAYLGVGHAVGLASGTDALVLGLKALGIGAGDGVVTVSHTAVATVAAIELCGAIPILLDVDPASFTMDPRGFEELETVLDGSVPIKAVVPVHLYGQPAAMYEIAAWAGAYGAVVLEDACQAHGAALHGQKVGGWGAMAAFSFYPTKNLGALGDGGALVTNDAALAERARELRQYGWRRRYISETAGLNSRLDELQAAILRVKLTRLEAHNARRLAIAARYREGLAGLPLVLPAEREDAVHVWHQFVVRVKGRDRVRDALAERGIGTGIHYPEPVHLQPAYRGRLWRPWGLAATEALAGEILSLPIYPQMTDEAVGRVIAATREALA
jgi:dTDP-4-amino-4,6-dideoxygalactose transaminase